MTPTWLKAAASRRLLAGILGSLSLAAPVVISAEPLRNAVFYYGDAANWDSLRAFQLAVVEPDAGPLSTSPPTGMSGSSKTDWFAYVSATEITAFRDYYFDVPLSWRAGLNTAWHSEIIDPATPGWPSFFVENVVTPLWNRGYTGFFLDTLDSYELLGLGEVQLERSRQGLLRLIRAIKDKYPEAKLILNRGFDLLPAIHQDVYAVAFESLYRAWNQAENCYEEVSEEDRAWLLKQIKRIQQRYKLPVIAVDYCPPDDGECAQETVRKIRALGLVPYVGDGSLQTVNRSAL
jgi:hypothetical protein